MSQIVLLLLHKLLITICCAYNSLEKKNFPMKWQWKHLCTERRCCSSRRWRSHRCNPNRTPLCSRGRSCTCRFRHESRHRRTFHFHDKVFGSLPRNLWWRRSGRWHKYFRQQPLWYSFLATFLWVDVTVAVRPKCSLWTTHFDSVNTEPFMQIRMLCFPVMWWQTRQNNWQFCHSTEQNNNFQV